jgi:SAM-dependent methyltransferase
MTPPTELHADLDEAYGAFAWAYDGALGKRFFRAAKRLLTPLLRIPAANKTHLDLCCGTALAVEFFTKHGYRSVGVDASLPMLRVGRRRARGLAAGDVRALPLRGTFDRITCLYDSLNHLQQRDQLVAVFSEVRRLMRPDSIFLFDMNHPDIYPAVWGMKEPFVESGPTFHLEIATRYSRANKRGHGLITGWAVLPDGERVAILETHEQRAWSRKEIVGCLAEAGLTARQVTEFDPFEEGRVVKLVFTSTIAPP